jgi:hypothetical protein
MEGWVVFELLAIILQSGWVGDKLFFDKREGSSLDLLTVNETAPEQAAVIYDGMGLF